MFVLMKEEMSPDYVADLKDLVCELDRWVTRKSKRWNHTQLSVLLMQSGMKIAFETTETPDEAVDMILFCLNRFEWYD
jgi:hypothetical protein